MENLADKQKGAFVNDTQQTEIEELNQKIHEIEQKQMKDSERQNLPGLIKLLKNVYKEFSQDLLPFYKKLDELSNDNTDTLLQQKLNKNFYRELDSLLQDPCNKEGKQSQQVNKETSFNKEGKQSQQVKKETSFNKDLSKEAFNRYEKIQKQAEEDNEKEIHNHFDIVIQLNHEFSEKLKGHAKQILGKNLIVDYHKDALMKFMNQSLKEKKCKEGKEVNVQKPKKSNEKIMIQVQFYKLVEGEPQKKNEKQEHNQNEEINRDVEVKTNEDKTKVENNSFAVIKGLRRKDKKKILEFPEVKIDSGNEVHKNTDGATKVEPKKKEFVNANKPYNNTRNSKIFTLCIRYIKKKVRENVVHKPILNYLHREYKSIELQKEFKELKREINDEQLQEIEKLLDDSDEVKLNTNKYFQKIIFVLLLRYNRLQSKPDFFQNVSLNFEQEDLTKKFEKKSFNLFNKLQLIHIKQSNKYAYSNKWPENCFQPSSLLDVLFDDPNEFKPYVLVIILHSVDKGYTININMDNNLKSSKKYSYNYSDDTILEHMENEHLPPDLLDLLDLAEPSLFYSGCVIAEIHDQVDGIPGRVYRLLLRPSNMSILRYSGDSTEKRCATNDCYWSYCKKLKMDNLIFALSSGVSCIDWLPIAGVEGILQHQMLNRRTTILNPLKRNYNSSKLKPLNTDLNNESNNDLSTSKVSSGPQTVSSKLMDDKISNINYSVLWKLRFSIKSLCLFKMYVIVITENVEHSMILITKAKYLDPIHSNMRFKVHIQQNYLKDYTKMVIEILRQKISPDVEVVWTYKSIYEGKPYSLDFVPALLNDNIYETSDADINQMINVYINNTHIQYLIKMLQNMFGHNYGKTDIESENINLSILHEKLAFDTQNTDEIKENSKGLEKKKRIQFCTTKKLSTNTKKILGLSNVDSQDQLARLSSLQISTIPKETLFHSNTKSNLSMSLLKENQTTTEIIRPINSTKEILVSSSYMIPISCPSTTIPFESSPITIISILPATISLIMSHKTYMLPIESSLSSGYIAKYTENIPVMKKNNLYNVDFYATMYKLCDSTNFMKEIVEDNHTLRYIQLFHQSPTLPDIETLPNVEMSPDGIQTLPDTQKCPVLPNPQVNTDPKDNTSDELCGANIFSKIESLVDEVSEEVKVKMGLEIKKKIQFCTEKMLSTNSKKMLGLSNVDLQDQIPGSSSWQIPAIPNDTIFNSDTTSLLKEKQTTTETSKKDKLQD